MQGNYALIVVLLILIVAVVDYALKYDGPTFSPRENKKGEK